MQESATAFPHGPMRRKEREITDRAQIDAILQSSRVMYLAMAHDDVPFLVPVFFAYDGTSVYFHSAQTGTKIELLRRNPRVCFAVSVDQDVIENEKACDFEARHRTAIGVGTAAFVDHETEKIEILNRIVARFTDKAFEYPPTTLEHTAVVRIAIESIKGKTHGLA